MCKVSIFLWSEPVFYGSFLSWLFILVHVFVLKINVINYNLQHAQNFNETSCKTFTFVIYCFIEPNKLKYIYTLIYTMVLKSTLTLYYQVNNNLQIQKILQIEVHLQINHKGCIFRIDDSLSTFIH